MIQKQLLHYEIVEKIGAGGMGEVFRARDTKLGRDVALKILPDVFADDPERLARFEREARLLASLNHSEIASIYGFENVDSTRFLVLEYVEGEDLAQRLSRGPIPVAEAINIARQVAGALEEAHERGIIHRDLKPANIKLTPDDKVKVLDFGLAKAMEAETESGSSSSDLSQSPTLMGSGTMHGVILGTAAYMGPEQARGKKVDRRTDIWAFGCVLFEMLTGRQLFSGETVSDTLAAVLRAELPLDSLPGSTPRPIAQLIKRCLDRDSSRRLQAIGEARIILDDVASGKDTGTDESPRKTPAWKAVAPWAVTTTVLIAAIVMLSRGGDPATAPREMTVTRVVTNPGITVNTAEHSLAISPDGSRLVYVGDDADGVSRLYLRRMDRDQSQVIPGTEGASAPFWSPDGKQIAFSGNGRLQRIEPDSRDPQAITIANVSSGGGAWGEDGNILFSTNSITPLKRVRASGGAVESWLDVIPEDQTEFVDRPRFLPGGKHLILRVGSLEGSPEGIYVVDYETKDAKRLLPVLSNVVYAPPGYLIYMQEDNLVAHRFDAETLELSGRPIPVASGVHRTNYPFRGFFDCSLEGQLVYLPGSGASAMTELVWVDREGNQLGEPVVIGDSYNHRLSHDDRRVAVDVSDALRTHGDIWVFDVARGSSVRMTNHPLDESLPVWALEDSVVYFARGNEIVVQPVDSNVEPRILYSDPSVKFTKDLSPDGRYLIYVQHGEAQTEIWLFDIERREVREWIATASNLDEPYFSPDGRWVAYESDENGRNEVFVERFPGREERFRISHSGGEQPMWRADGKEIYYYSHAGKIMAVPVDMDAAGRSPIGEPVALFSTSLRRDDYEVTNDGQRFLLNRRLDTAEQTSIVLIQNWVAGLD